MYLKILTVLTCMVICPYIQGQDLETLYGEMVEMYQNKEYAAGIEKTEKLLTLAEQSYGGKDTNFAKMLNFAGFFYHQSYLYDKAEILYGQSLDIFENAFGKHHLYYANLAINLADVKTGLKKYIDAEKLYLEAFDVYKDKKEWRPQLLTYFIKIAQLYEVMLKFAEAEQIYKKLVKEYKELYGAKSEFHAYGQFNLAQFYEKTSNYPLALSLYESSLNTYKSVLGPQHTTVAYTLNYLGHANEILGNYVVSEAQYREALNIYKKAGGEPNEYMASILNNLGNLYFNTGRFEEAIKIYYAVAEIYQNTIGTDHEFYATALNNIAMASNTLGDVNQANEIYDKVEMVYKRVYGEQHPFYTTLLVNRANFYKTLKNHTAAKFAYEKAIQLHEQSKRTSHPDYAITLYHLAQLEKTTNQIPNAILHAEKALELQIKLLGNKHISTNDTRSLLGMLYFLNHQKKKTLDLFYVMSENIIDLTENYFPSLNNNDKAAFYEKIKPMIEYFLSIGGSMVKEHPEISGKLFDTRIRTKAILLNSFHKVRNAVYSSKDSSLIKLFIKWNAQKETLGKTFTMSEEELNQQNIHVDLIKANISQLEKELSIKSSEFSKSYSLKPSHQQISALLKPNEAAVEIIQIPDIENDTLPSYFVLVLKRNQAPIVLKMGNAYQMEHKYYAYYCNSIQQKSLDQNSYQHYWQALEQVLSGTKTIYFSADGVYNKLNIGTIYNPKTQSYLAKEYDIVHLSNTRELISRKAPLTPDILSRSNALILGYPDYKFSSPSQGNQGTTATIDTTMKNEMLRAFDFGEIPDLIGTQQEVNGLVPIMQASKIPTIVFMRQDATEEAIKSAQNTGILHVATHGFFIKKNSQEQAHRQRWVLGNIFSNSDPLINSGLLLAGAEKTLKGQPNNSKEDGILTAYEASNLQLQGTHLVVLSACETGLGDIENGEGVYGLQRALSIAGARYIMLSLWKVNDLATQELMISFYHKWLKSADIYGAFKEAQLELQNKYKDPIYWGAFVLYGI